MALPEPAAEFGLIEKFRRITHDTPQIKGVHLGIGDDAAWIVSSSRDLLITVDMLVEEVHFRFDLATPYSVGRKAMNVNFSDIAAMGGWPTAAVVAVALPPSLTEATTLELFQGVRSAANRFGVPLVGGDTNRSSAGLVLSVTVVGQPFRGADGSPQVVTRSHAQVDDVLFVTGPLGYSLDGKHLSFEPRLEFAQWLMTQYPPHAMMDLSDGLGGDLFHILRASKVGAELWAESIPIRVPNRRCEEWDPTWTPLDHALRDGEDFELLFTLSPALAEKLEQDAGWVKFGIQLQRIGRIIAEPAAWIVQGEKRTPLQPSGYVHEMSG